MSPKARSLSSFATLHTGTLFSEVFSALGLEFSLAFPDTKLLEAYCMQRSNLDLWII